MSNDKIYKKLPVVLQTTAIKNFFESTVEQLFSKSNVETINGFIGHKTSVDENILGYINEPTVERAKYALSPVVNTVNFNTAASENLIFFDEFVSTLETYGVNVKNQNKLFASNFNSFMPPIDIDKFINYQEYYWFPKGPSSIAVEGTLVSPIDIVRDIVGKTSYTSPNGVTLRNGMVIRFRGVYVIPQSLIDRDFIVEGVGEKILLVDKQLSAVTRFSTVVNDPYDGTGTANNELDEYHSSANISSVVILNQGIGYVNPSVTFNGTNTSPATGSVTVAANGAITAVTVSDGGVSYSGVVGIQLVDVLVQHNIDHANMALEADASVFITDEIRMDSVANVKVGQQFDGVFNGVVFAVNSNTNTVTLTEKITFVLDQVQAAPQVNFSGKDFLAEVRLDDMHIINTDSVNILPIQARLGINPNTGEYYLLGGAYAFDAINNPLIEEDDLRWDGGLGQSVADYLLQARGATNKNVWSRVNYWYHKQNFLDAGNEVPSREFRANRPILEFDKNLELHNHGLRSMGAVEIASTLLTKNEVHGAAFGLLLDDVPAEGATIIFPNEIPNNAKYVYIAEIDTDSNSDTFRRLILRRLGHPILNPIGAVDGDLNFVPFELVEGDVLLINNGKFNIGKEYVFGRTGLVLAQEKLSVNQAPLFNLYDSEGNYLGDEGVYPNNNFSGNKIFSYAVSTTSTVKDPVLGFSLILQPFKARSEILFEITSEAYVHRYTPFGSDDQVINAGYKFHKLNGDTVKYFTVMKPSQINSTQKITTTYTLDTFDVDRQQLDFYIGCVPNLNVNKPSGYDIDVFVNSLKRTDFQYGVIDQGLIRFNEFNFSAGDFIEIIVGSSSGLLKLGSISSYDIPMSWRNNPRKTSIVTIAEPEFLPHFKHYIENQSGFVGEPLSVNNFTNTIKEIKHANDIVINDYDLILGAFLLDDQQHNLLDALRFNSSEYQKYKSRVKKEINSYFSQFDITDTPNEQVLEQVLRNVISYNIGREVFNRTYIVPFGDNYIQEQFVINDISVDEFVLTAHADLNKIENALLVYKNDVLLCIEECYDIVDYSPITIKLLGATVQLGDVITAKLYNSERDSAQCPPTPSTMGLYPLFYPQIVEDNTFQNAVNVLLGHDGSKTVLWGDKRDQVLLDFERRIYNSAKAEFRSANALPPLNIYAVKPGVFRSTGFSNVEWTDMLRYNFAQWITNNNLDFVTNEFYDQSNEWTWNYRGDGDNPGHWRGWYEYYYDTVRPHTHPWEMLAFFEKPIWWDTQYGTDYSSSNKPMWNDIEQGLIRQGPRSNLVNDAYLTENPYRREGLHLVLPVDSSANLRTPKEIFTTGSTTKTEIWQNTVTGNDAPTAFQTSSYLAVNGLNISFDSDNVYVKGENIINHSVAMQTNAVGFGPIESQPVSYVLPLTNLAELDDAFISSDQPQYAVAVMVNGISYYNPKSTKSWNDAGDWHYNNGTIQNYNELSTYSHSTVDGLFHYHSIVPEILGLDEWDRNQHSSIVGWAFDGLPIYGPYGYTHYASNGTIINSEITNIKSAFKLRSGKRVTSPGGAYTGMFVEDYELDLSVAGTAGHADRFNKRYGVTPDSPTTPIHFYVVTVDDDLNPMFPYAVGGDVISHTDSTLTWGNKYFGTALQPELNTQSAAIINPQATLARASTLNIQYTVTDVDAVWKFGDNAPVENAWRYTEAYPFAVVEALLLARPGEFATKFADPTKLYRASVNKDYLLSTESNRPWHYWSPDDFEIHGETNLTGDFVTNIGYSQFVHTWLKFQNLDTTVFFVDKVRTLSTKLGHRMAGFIDKDTMTLRTDQYSGRGDATSLIIPTENVNVQVHSSPYKTRNSYSGVIIEKTAIGYKVRGYDKNLSYFNTLASDISGPRERVTVGGNPAPFVEFTLLGNYKPGTIVRYQNVFYTTNTEQKNVQSFDRTLWRRLGSLPQIGGASATFYQKSLDTVVRVDYETEFTDIESLYDFLIGLGRYQQSQGYDFGVYDTEIADVRNWSHAAKQLLFWVTGKWEIGNTLELSPSAKRLVFQAPRGFIAKINRSERNQFTLMDQNGVSIAPEQCEIVREDNRIEIVPPEDRQIYGAVLFTKETEHAMVIDNITQFNDVIFNPTLNQAHSRMKLKAKRTAGWDGRFLTQGFIIDGDELRPNLDNLAESLGRFHELGFVPVDKQMYDSARAIFGFEQKDYLRELDILDDDQFEFYKGMIQNKGTSASLSKIARSSAVVRGDITVFDEWALRVADFGDTENDQSIELKIEKSEIVSDPQLVTLAFPEDVTGIVNKVEILERKHKYLTPPQIIISAPQQSNGVRATATATLRSNGELDFITVVDGGTGYGEHVGLKVIAGNIVVTSKEVKFNPVFALSEGEWIDVSNLTELVLTNHITNVTSNISLNSVTTEQELANVINSANTGIVASVIRSDILQSGIAVDKYTLQLVGSDFTIDDADANLHLTTGFRYQPRQRYEIQAANNTVEANIVVRVDGTAVDSSNWEFDQGDRWQITTAAVVDANSAYSVTLTSGIDNGRTQFDFENTQLVDNERNYLFVDVYINGIKILNQPNQQIYTLSNTQVNFANISLLPKEVLTPLPNPAVGQTRFVLNNKSNVFIVEKPTIDFTDSYQGDLPGSTLNIQVETNDAIAIKLGTKRIYEITPDAKDDEVILIDIDDAERFLKKPLGVREFNLWSTTNKVDHTGITDKKFVKMPNAGYVNSANINFMAYDIASLPDLFGEDVIIKPQGGSLIHMAASENNDWNVYELVPPTGTVSFLTRNRENNAVLYTNSSLFEFIDSNLIGEGDTSRYLDFYLTLKNANVSDSVVMWTNESIVQQKQSQISNFRAPRMIEARIKSIGPASGSLLQMSNVEPIATRTYRGAAISDSDTNNMVTVSNIAIPGLTENDAIQLKAGVTTTYTFNATITFNSVGNVTVNSANVDFVVAPGHVTLLTDGDNTANNDQYFVSNVAVGSFTIIDDYFTDANVVAALGNVRYVVETFEEYGNSEVYYIASNVTASSFTIERANTVASTVNVVHMNQSKIQVSSNHGLEPGDVVKIFSNAFLGVYTVRSTPSDTTFIVDAPFTFDTDFTGTVLKPGVEIITTDAHGIHPLYAENKKRIALHFVTPKTYNQVFTVNNVTPNSVVLNNQFAYDDRTRVYFDVASGYANAASNTITVSHQPLLSSTTVLYTGNSQIVPSYQYIVNPTNVVINADALSSDANVSINFTIVREKLNLGDNRYPVMTTVDHNSIKLNNSEIVINSFNNPEGAVLSINRSQNIKRSQVVNVGPNKFSVGFNVLRDYRNSNLNTPNYGPYARTVEDLGETGRIISTSKMMMNDPIEFVVDSEFNKGPIYVGPTKGFTYNKDGVLYIWDFGLKKYLPQFETVTFQTTGQLSGTNFTGTSIIAQSVGDVFGVDSDSVDEELLPINTDDQESEQVTLPALHSSGNTLSLIPGSAKFNPLPSSTMGRKWAQYDMTEQVTLGTTTLSRWRLKTNSEFVYEIYEAVQNAAGTVYYILVDRVYPPLIQHDVAATISAYNDFGGKIQENFYYLTGTQFDGTIKDRASANAVGAGYIDIPPVEPAFYVGKQLIPEPFAVLAGNGSDKKLNFSMLPGDIVIGTEIIGGETRIRVNSAGMNSFFMWQPGLTPGQWEPKQEGPGALPGRFDVPVFWGFGRGYYSANDIHEPNSPLSLTGSGYPGFSITGWNRRQPRFKYNKDFTVFPTQTPETGYTLFDDQRQNPADQTIYSIRPEEIFVACFWTEPFVYKNQLIGYNYNNLDAAGNPAPIYDDYSGTVTRVKYIRLTEIPADAVLRRPIADTGWGGKGWKNSAVDNVVLPGEFGSDPAALDVWRAFDPQFVSGGSTGDAAEAVSSTDIVNPISAITVSRNQPGLGEGLGRSTPVEVITLADPEDNSTVPSPVLNANYMSTLPSRCVVVPIIQIDNNKGTCFSRPSKRDSRLLTQLSAQTHDENGEGLLEVHELKVVGKNPFILFFDFSELGVLANGVTIEQAANKEDFDAGISRLIVDTRSEVNGAPEVSGNQIGSYGLDNIPLYNKLFLNEVNDSFGVSINDVLNNQLRFTAVNGDRLSTIAKSPRGFNVGVRGFGWVQRTIDCSRGEWVRITVSKGRGNTSGRYNLHVIYFSEDTSRSTFNSTLSTCENTPSSAYIDGAVERTWRATNRKPSLTNRLTFGLFGRGEQNRWGYFGATSKDTSGTWDNIYYPYHSITKAPGHQIVGGDMPDTHANTAEGGGGQFVATATRKTITSYAPSIAGQISTAEFKGYFYAPINGTYVFRTISDDGSYVWVSDVDDTSDKEKYTNDGYNSELGSRNYTWSNATVSNGGVRAPKSVTGALFLRGGKYYFVRGIYGNARKGFEFRFEVQMPNSTSFVPVEFSGKYCEPEVNGTRGCTATNTFTGELGSFTGIGEYFGYNDYFLNYQDGLGTNYDNTIYKFGNLDIGDLPPTQDDDVTVVCSADTPIINPAPVGVNSDEIFADQNNRISTGTFTDSLFGSDILLADAWAITDSRELQGNFTGYSQDPMTGFNFMPSNFKTPTPRSVVAPQRLGYSVDLGAGRFVNATSQRVTGGAVIPLASTVTAVSRTPAPLRSYNIENEPWYKRNTLGSLNKTFRNVTYDPKRIGSTLNFNGRTVNNVINNINTASTPNSVIVNSVAGESSIPAVGVTATGANLNNMSMPSTGPAVEVPLRNQKFDNVGIEFARIPTINITPLIYDRNIGTYAPAGTPAVASIYKATPSTRISASVLPGVSAGSELFINNKKITFRQGTTAREIANQFKCGETGVDVRVINTAEGTEELDITSCSDNPITIRNGCGGGSLKRVGDFHVVRGFEQIENSTETVTNTANATVLPAATGFGNVILPTVEYTRFSVDGLPLGVMPDVTTTETGSVHDILSVTNSVSRSKSLAGTGYAVGDRLRLVGGTPINNTKGPITILCITNPGAGYNNPANIRIQIGDGNTPGYGAAAEVISLDPETGGISAVRLLNPGVGYDVEHTPTITITDRSNRSWISADINEDSGTYGRNTILELQGITEIDVNGNMLSTTRWFRVSGNSVTIGETFTYDTSDVSLVDVIGFPVTPQLKVRAANVSDVSYIVPMNTVTLLTSGDATANNRSYLVTQVNRITGEFWISDTYFADSNVVAGLGTVEFSVKKPIDILLNEGNLTPITDQRLGVTPAEITALVATQPKEGGGLEFVEGFRSFAGPLRVAKFVVTSVDDDGGITSLRVLDRGLYKVFPADLTYGIPLEYDFEYVGNTNPPNNALGVADPNRDNLQYGPGHPEYDAGVFVNGRHPDFHIYPEFKFDPIANNFTTYNGTPGGYDPLTYVEVNGKRLNKVYKIDLDPLSPTYGEYVLPLQVGGGTGARVFLTAEEVPDCSEAGRAKETLGLPNEVSQIDVPQALADALNGALVGAGYRPEDIRAEVIPVGPSVGQVKIVSNYPGFNIGTNTPGFPEKFGLETGDYNNGMLCIKATLSTPNLSLSDVEQQVNQLYNNSAFGLLSNESIQQFLPPATAQSNRLITPPTVLSLFCVDNIVSDPNSPLFSDQITYVNELYRYDIQNIFGSPVTLQGAAKQQTNVYAFESRRYDTFDQYQGLLAVPEEPIGNVWVDSYVNHDSANISMPNFISGGWAYLENDVPQRWQTALVDTAFINNAIIYDRETGHKEFDLEFWDPFKGVLPGFVRNELHFINDVDPVNYNNARTNFGSNNVGKVWWDTSTLRYMWYEQGSNRERWKNWGRTFPGSSITVCEWVESRALPQNWNGNGTPRWADRYITERRQDPSTGQYVNYYYYWVQNRSKLDDRVKQLLGRKFDSLTLARYIANPIGYGLNLISFVSDQSFVLSNIAERLREDENIIQINLSRNLNPDGLKHTAWKLMREGDNNSVVPEHLSNKLIDSLCGENGIGQPVPDPMLSVVEKYGIAFRPRQTMFRDIKAARRVMATVINEILADTQLQTNYPNWKDALPSQLTYFETVSWYAVDRVDKATNSKIRYDSSYKPVFNVNSVAELQTLNNLPDGSVIQVKPNARSRAQLWLYTSGTDSFKQIAVADETVRIKNSVFVDDTNAVMANELRLFLNTLKNVVFVNTANWNKLFFALLKNAYMEQQQLSWAFKTSYVYVEKEEQDLVKITGFKPDNFDKVIEYMNEVKPFTAKIREYKDGKTAPIETIGATTISDFDKPPYADRVNGVIRVLDDFDSDDANIMANDPTYQNYQSITNKTLDPFRKGHMSLTFDRTNWRLTQFGYNASTTSFELSIARNMANINSMTAAQVSSNTTMRAVDRIFKFDPSVRLNFAIEVSAHYGDITAGSNPNIINNTTMLYDVIQSGNLSVTQQLIKEKVGGGWRGETVDAALFTRFVEGLDSTDDYITHFGWDTDLWDTVAFDRDVQVVNYEGIFNEFTQGNITLRKNNETYEGFDGVTFKRVLYGEERPEELVMLSPLESLIIDVYTSPFANGDANTTPVSPTAVDVKYRMHQNLFGETEYLRILDNKQTTVASEVFTHSTEITVTDATVLRVPKLGDPGVIWIGSERVIYHRVDGNVLGDLIRGTAGTTVQDHQIGQMVWDGAKEETFQNLNSNFAFWLDTDGANTATSLSDVANVNLGDIRSVMKFIHNI
jgi:hypothetical protein